MSLSALNCPHCAGSFLVDSSMVGQEALCPNCKGMIVVPSIESTVPPVAPAETTSHFACPVCLQAFAALASMGGQQVLCPHCGSTIAVPHGPSEAPITAPPMSQPALPMLQPAPSSVERPHQPRRDPRVLWPGPGPLNPLPPSSVAAAPPALSPAPRSTPVENRPAAKLPSVNRPIPAPAVEAAVEDSPTGVEPKIREPAQPAATTATGEPVRKLSPQERARYRLIKNAIVLTFCAVVLGILFLVLRYMPILKEL
jgi:DNA-directed RNA polymerase subunit RPC12/RpoP